jgi:hypothetical protein
MSILDLQGLTAPEEKGPSGSRASKGCGNQSTLSVLCTL